MKKSHFIHHRRQLVSVALLTAFSLLVKVRADDLLGFLPSIHKHKFLTSTIADNGDLNPYAVVVAPVTAGVIEQGDVLVDNFNNVSNLQGTGTTIIRYRPATKETTLFVKLPQNLPSCPGGVGLTTAMTMLRSGWIIVGSTPSTDGTTKTKGRGCLLVIDPNGKLSDVWVSQNIDGPWGNMVALERGEDVTLFVSMAGAGLEGPAVIDPSTRYPVVKHNATVLRLALSVVDGKVPKIVKETIVGSNFAHRADRDNFLLGPTGLAVDKEDNLYVTDGLENEITRISNASSRDSAAGKGDVVTRGGLLSWPLAMALTDQDHLLVNNGRNGQVVEVDIKSGQQLFAHWLNVNQAQSPPGNGNLFGLCLALDGKSFYYVEDDINSLRVATR